MKKILSGTLIVVVILAQVCVGLAAEKKVLVYTKAGKGYVHGNIAACADVIKKLGAANGFAVDISADPSKFTDDNLKQYSALVFDNTSNNVLDSDDQKAALQKYIKAGGGFVGIHAASIVDRNWPWYWSLIGGKFKTHPKAQDFILKVEDKNHPSTSFLGDSWKIVKDECYFHTDISKNIHVLLSTDVTQLKPNKEGDDLIAQAGSKIVPISWCQNFEGGRVWFTALGHNPEHFEDVNLQKHILGGIIWAMGQEKK